jgi:molybdopterin converting factor small subunit
MVRVRFYGQIRKRTGAQEVAVEDATGLKLKDLLSRWAAGTEGPSAGLLNSILINGRNCLFREGLDTVVADGDLIDVLPLVGGG